MEGWGKLSTKNLEEAVNKAKKISLNRFIYSIGIRHIGQENAKILARYFKSANKFKDIFNSKKREEILNDLKDLDGIGMTQIQSLDSFFSNGQNSEVVKSLITKLKIDDFLEKSRAGKLSNKNIMFTGAFKKISRSEAKSIAENFGGKVLGSISKKVDILVVGDKKPTRKKIDAAKQLSIKIFSEKEWYKLLNI